MRGLVRRVGAEQTLVGPAPELPCDVMEGARDSGGVIAGPVLTPVRHLPVKSIGPGVESVSGARQRPSHRPPALRCLWSHGRSVEHLFD